MTASPDPVQALFYFCAVVGALGLIFAVMVAVVALDFHLRTRRRECEEHARRAEHTPTVVVIDRAPERELAAVCLSPHQRRSEWRVLRGGRGHHHQGGAA